MTKDEAIKVLLSKPAIAPSNSERQKKLNEAIDMAIGSLSADSVRIEVYRDIYVKYMNLKHKTEWIPCSERLPSKARYYLCCNKGYLPFIAHYFDGQWHCFDETTPFVDAWMPLPESYKGRREE